MFFSRTKTRWNIELTQEEIISSTLHMLLMKYFRFLLSVYKGFKDVLPDRFRYCFLWLKEISFFWQGGTVKRLFKEEPLQILTIWIKSVISHITGVGNGLFFSKTHFLIFWAVPVFSTWIHWFTNMQKSMWAKYTYIYNWW